MVRTNVSPVGQRNKEVTGRSRLAHEMGMSITRIKSANDKMTDVNMLYHTKIYKKWHFKPWTMEYPWDKTTTLGIRTTPLRSIELLAMTSKLGAGSTAECTNVKRHRPFFLNETMKNLLMFNSWKTYVHIQLFMILLWNDTFYSNFCNVKNTIFVLFRQKFKALSSIMAHVVCPVLLSEYLSSAFKIKRFYRSVDVFQ